MAALPGPESGAGNEFVYCRAPWGMTIELQHDILEQITVVLDLAEPPGAGREAVSAVEIVGDLGGFGGDRRGDDPLGVAGSQRSRMRYC